MNSLLKLMTVLALGTVTSSRTATGAEFRTPLPGLTLSAGNGATYLTSEFDFGFGFRRIDSVSLAIYAPGGFGGLGITTNGFANPSLDLLIAEDLSQLNVDELLLPEPSTVEWIVTPVSPNPPDVSPPTYIERVFSLNNLDILDDPGVLVEDIDAWDLSYYNGQPEQIVPIAVVRESPGWLPAFLASGRGEVALGANLTYLLNALPGHPIDPPIVGSAYLVIVGQAVPEPGSTAIIAAIAFVGLARCRRTRSA